MTFRSSSLAAGLLSLLVASGAGDAAPPAPHEKEESVRVTNALQASAVRTKLIEKLGGDALKINVTVAGEKAFLTGSVEKKVTQEMAKEVALSVPGIKSVENELKEIAGAGAAVASGHEVEDALLESKVKNVLLAEIGVNAFRIEVESTDGVVSLRGKLANANVVRAAVEKAESIKGVKRVINLLNA